jgi:hypothetical protein
MTPDKGEIDRGREVRFLRKQLELTQAELG